MAAAIDKKLTSREELKLLVRELLTEILWEMEQQQPDPDEGLELKPEIAEYLRQTLKDKPRGTPLAEVKRRLGYDD